MLYRILLVFLLGLSFSVLKTGQAFSIISQNEAITLEIVPEDETVPNYVHNISIRIPSSAPVNNLYGISFVMRIHSPDNPGAAIFTSENDPPSTGYFWDENDLLTFHQVIDSSQYDISFVQSSGISRSGTGLITEIPITTTMPGSVILDLVNIVAIDSNGNELQVNPVSELHLTIQDPPRPFITTWQTDNTGISADNQIRIEGTGTDYWIEWEEVGNSTNSGAESGSGTHTLTFPSAGTFRVSISGNFTAMRFDAISFDENDPASDARKLLSVEQWGDIQWSSMERMFNNASNFQLNATDNPDLSQVSSMAYTFRQATSFNQPIGDWDVGSVTSMEGAFMDASVFNQDISEWNVSNVSRMEAMFWQATSFNQDISLWDVSNVETMRGMFLNAESFNQPIGTWDVGSVTQMSSMFWMATAFDQALNGWNVGNVTDMNGMFLGAYNFNQDLSSWDVSNVTRMDRMFHLTELFNQDVGGWSVQNVTNMGGMFEYALSFDQNLADWNLVSVVDDGNPENIYQGVRSIFDNSGMSQSNYEASLNGWASADNFNDWYDNLTLGAENMRYCVDNPGRMAMTTSFDWNILGDIPTPCIPELVSPSDLAADVQVLNREFTWLPATDANDYSIQVSDTLDFEDPLVNLSSVSDTSFTDDTLLEFTSEYYWRVRSHTPSDTSDWSAPFSFTTISTPETVTYFPGDTNNDGVVNSADLLFIGNYFNFRGYTSDATGDIWNSSERFAWPGDDNRYRMTRADADGNGIINAEDIIVIGRNYGLTHDDASDTGDGQPAQSLPESPELPETIYLLAEVGKNQIRLILEESVPLYGLYLNIEAPDFVTQAGFVADSSLSQPSLRFARWNSGNHTLDLAIVRTDRRLQYIDGLIAELNFTTENETNILPEQISIHSARAHTLHGHVLPVEIQLTKASLTSAEPYQSEAPSSFELYPNYPNPFNPSTTIRFSLPESGITRLMVFDILGREISDLVNGQMSAGTHSVQFDARGLSSGIYFYRLTHHGDESGAQFERLRRMTFVK